MFIKELKLNVDYLKEQTSESGKEDNKQLKDALDFSKQLLLGIEYYRSISDKISNSDRFNDQLAYLESEINTISNKILSRLKIL